MLSGQTPISMGGLPSFFLPPYPPFLHLPPFLFPPSPTFLLLPPSYPPALLPALSLSLPPFLFAPHHPDIHRIHSYPPGGPPISAGELQGLIKDGSFLSVSRMNKEGGWEKVVSVENDLRKAGTGGAGGAGGGEDCLFFAVIFVIVFCTQALLYPMLSMPNSVTLPMTLTLTLTPTLTLTVTLFVLCNREWGSRRREGIQSGGGQTELEQAVTGSVDRRRGACLVCC